MHGEDFHKPTAGAADRAPAVQEMFDCISPRYDLANRVLSLGLDQAWRRKALAALGDRVEGVMVDLCTGTMDLVPMLLDRGATQVHAIDFSAGMLKVGQAKIPAGAPVQTHQADARDLPLDDASVDGIIIAFGIRNVPGFEDALAECARVLRPGGRLVILDFFQPDGFVARGLQDSYNRFIVPVVGGWITGTREAYTYLFESIDAFTSRAGFEAAMAEAGFEVSGQDMFPPVASMVVGTRNAQDEPAGANDA